MNRLVRSNFQRLLLGLIALITTVAGWSRILADDFRVNECPDGFRPLFEGQNLDGWHGRPHFDPRQWLAVSAEQRDQWNQEMRAHWKSEDGELVNDGDGPYLTTDEEFGDFELWIQYKTVPKADSGIYLRGNPQVQIWDSTDESKFGLDADKGSGGLWNNSPGAPGKNPSVLADLPFGEWNQFRIRLVGERCSVWLNGHLVVDHARMENFWDRESPLFSRGPIQLQTHGGEIRWRHIYIRDIGSEEANQILSEQIPRDEFVSLFDGESLAGWTGALDNYEVADGAIQCKEGKGGVLYTERTFANFQVQLEFQLPPGGNNGLAIRYPGHGDAAYSGMCELQVLDNDADQYASLDPRQYHGSAYGMVPAARGFHRPVGEWNFQVVTVDGSKIRVELNGTRILDADLSTVEEFMANSPHPGKDLAEGHFGFAGHHDPVRFRAIFIKELP